MFKNLNAEILGVSARQSELIELSLTYRFKGIDLDMASMAKRVVEQGDKLAYRYLENAPLYIGGFDLPVHWQGPESDYKADLAKLAEIVEVASVLKAQRCYTTVLPASDELPFQENFETCRQRLTEIAGVLESKDIRIGLRLLAAAAHRKDKQFEFIHQAETMLALLKTVATANVGLALDTWDWTVGGGGMEQLQELTADQIVLVRLADVPAKAELASIDERDRLLPGSNETSNIDGILLLLAEKGYDGPISVCPDPSQLEGLSRDAVLRKVSETLDERYKAAGLSKSGKVVAVAEA